MRVVIERRDGHLLCGMFFYQHKNTSDYISWSVDTSNPRTIVLTLFPTSSKKNYQIVKENYKLIGDTIINEITKKQ